VFIGWGYAPGMETTDQRVYRHRLPQQGCADCPSIPDGMVSTGGTQIYWINKPTGLCAKTGGHYP